MSINPLACRQILFGEVDIFFTLVMICEVWSVSDIQGRRRLMKPWLAMQAIKLTFLLSFAMYVLVFVNPIMEGEHPDGDIIAESSGHHASSARHGHVLPTTTDAAIPSV